MSNRIIATALGAALLMPGLAVGESSEEITAIRRELESMREAYEARLRELEARLEQAESRAREQATAAWSTPRAQQEAPPTPQASYGSGANRFNPALSVILQGSLNSYSQNPDDYALPGFQLGGEAGLPAEGFTLDETEIIASASVDHLFAAQTTLALHDDGHDTEIELEEAYIDPLALPAGLGGRFGRFYSDIGYLNRFHPHAWDFRDNPLVYRAFLGRQYGDDGVRLSWIAPTDIYFTLGAERFAGNNFPAGESQRTLGDVQSLYLKLGGDVGSSHAWQAGVSGLWVDAHDREGGGHAHAGEDPAATSFSGDSTLAIADFVWRWAPQGNPRQRNLKLQSEFFYRDESGHVTVSEDAAPGLLDYDGTQKGWYAQAVYQFIPHWRLGLRYDWLSANNDLSALDLGSFADAADLVAASGLDSDGHDPQRWSGMLDWSPSEFSRLRLQYNRDQSRPDNTDHQWTLQYLMSIGSHGAHEF
jgi:hypothetical protein